MRTINHFLRVTFLGLCVLALASCSTFSSNANKTNTKTGRTLASVTKVKRTCIEAFDTFFDTKEKNPHDFKKNTLYYNVAIPLSVVLLASSAFGLGRLSAHALKIGGKSSTYVLIAGIILAAEFGVITSALPIAIQNQIYQEIVFLNALRRQVVTKSGPLYLDIKNFSKSSSENSFIEDIISELKEDGQSLTEEKVTYISALNSDRVLAYIEETPLPQNKTEANSFCQKTFEGKTSLLTNYFTPLSKELSSTKKQGLF